MLSKPLISQPNLPMSSNQIDNRKFLGNILNLAPQSHASLKADSKNTAEFLTCSASRVADTADIGQEM